MLGEGNLISTVGNPNKPSSKDIGIFDYLEKSIINKKDLFFVNNKINLEVIDDVLGTLEQVGTLKQESNFHIHNLIAKIEDYISEFDNKEISDEEKDFILNKLKIMIEDYKKEILN